MSKRLNRVKCKNCKKIVVSRHRHDFAVCDCWKNDFDNPGIAIDGGNDYCRYIGNIKNFLVFKNRKWVPLKLKEN